jgi:hypothetical protein
MEPDSHANSFSTAALWDTREEKGESTRGQHFPSRYVLCERRLGERYVLHV